MLPADQGHYLRQVMRLQTGDEVILFNGTGGEHLGIIDHLSKQESYCSVGRYVDANRELGCRVHIIQAACRGEKVDIVLQKGTELGAASFHIVRTERSTLKLDEGKKPQRLQRWQKIVMEAAEQSGRTALPIVSWHDSLNSLPNSDAAFALHPEGTASFASLRGEVLAAQDIHLAIGPEGGWSNRDLDKLQACGFRTLTFGNRILRTETAAPAMLAAIQAVRDYGST